MNGKERDKYLRMWGFEQYRSSSSGARAVARTAETLRLTDPTLVSPSGGAWKVEVGKLTGFGNAFKELVNARFDAGNKIGIEVSDTDAVQAFSFIQNAFQGGPDIATDVFTSTSTIARDTVYRAAFRYSANDFAAAYSAALESSVKTAATGKVLSKPFSMVALGNNNGGQQLYGYLRSVEYIPPHRLTQDATNAQLLAWAQP